MSATLSTRCRLALHWYGVGSNQKFLCAVTKDECRIASHPEMCSTAKTTKVTPELLRGASC